tara:strand:- start:41141 stop:42202 length:1062 start_codon:yes stop_codon:yes gene_type:complete
MSNFKINKFEINEFSKPYLIAEIGVNHEGSIETAKMLIDLAKEGGANAAKFQSYKAELLASKNSPSYWDLSKESNQSQFKLFQKYDNFNPDDYEYLAEYCKKIEIDFLSTPFDSGAIDYLCPLVPAFKIASADITNFPFLKKIGGLNKPTIISTGASTLEEIKNAVKILESSGCSNIALLHCILNYPTDNKNAHLSMISNLMSTFPNKIIGYSDHTLPNRKMSSLILSYVLGARIIEKHFTYDKSLPGNDHYHAMDIDDLKNFNLELNFTIDLLGDLKEKQPIESEKIAIQNARRSIVLKNNIAKDQILSEKDLTYKRPGTGISPEYWDEVVGKKINKSLKEDQILNWEDIDS